jgi:hypothetical protein
LTPEPSSRPDDEHQVLQFRPRNEKAGSRHVQQLRHSPQKATPPQADGLARYETEDEDTDNYRHRMMVNVAALLVTVALAVAGGWLAMQIADLRKKQDCVLSGRSNCMRIETTSPRQP